MDRTTGKMAIMVKETMETIMAGQRLVGKQVQYHLIVEKPTNIEEILKGVPNFKRHSNKFLQTIYGGNWYTFSIKPLPPRGERLKLISDFYNQSIEDKCIVFENGIVGHCKNCMEEAHNLLPEIRNITMKFESISYDIAMWDNPDGYLENQPIFIPLNPEINKFKYPKHPHLNDMRVVVRDKKRIFIPNTICYLHDISNLSRNRNTRLFEAFSQIPIWLIKHQIWEKLRKKSDYKYDTYKAWIGQEQFIPIEKNANGEPSKQHNEKHEREHFITMKSIKQALLR